MINIINDDPHRIGFTFLLWCCDKVAFVLFRYAPTHTQPHIFIHIFFVLYSFLLIYSIFILIIYPIPIFCCCLSLFLSLYLTRLSFFSSLLGSRIRLSPSSLLLDAKHPPSPSMRSCASNTNLTLRTTHTHTRWRRRRAKERTNERDKAFVRSLTSLDLFFVREGSLFFLFFASRGRRNGSCLTRLHTRTTNYTPFGLVDSESHRKWENEKTKEKEKEWDAHWALLSQKVVEEWHLNDIENCLSFSFSFSVSHFLLLCIIVKYLSSFQCTKKRIANSIYSFFYYYGDQTSGNGGFCYWLPKAFLLREKEGVKRERESSPL